MRRSALTCLLWIIAATPALAGPPWIRVQLPADHTAGVARGGFLVLRTMHRGEQAWLPEVYGTAWSLRGDTLAAESLIVERTDSAGLYLVRRTGGGGPAVLNVVGVEHHFGAGVVVAVDASGRPLWVVTPRTATGVSRAATPRELRRLLASLTAGQTPADPRDPAWKVILTMPGALSAAVLALLVSLPVLVIVRRRRAMAHQAAQ